MRVVNNVEQEMIKAEWENWLLDENSRCKQVQMMLRDDGTGVDQRAAAADSQTVLGFDERERSGRSDELCSWHEEYCGSCQLEQDLLLTGGNHLRFE